MASVACLRRFRLTRAVSGSLLLLVALLAGLEGVAAQESAEPTAATVEVTVWRRVSDPSLLYLSARPEGGRWRTENVALDMSALSRSGRFHQSNAVLVEVPLAGGTTANVEVTVWRRVSNPSLLYLSTRPEGGRWKTENAPLDMSALSRSGRFHQSNPVTVAVPLPDQILISGRVLGPDGAPVRTTRILFFVSAVRTDGQGSVGSSVQPSGEFNLPLNLRPASPEGTYVLSVACPGVTGELGWYQEQRGYTTARREATVVTVDDASISGIVIRLPASPEQLFPACFR